MALTIPIAHDFICPWCWVALLQVNRLKAEFDVEFDWLGYELFPDELEWPDWTAGTPPPANKPPVLSRFDFILVADGVEVPNTVRPHKMRTHNAHEALEYAKSVGKGEEMAEALYRAYWEGAKNINDVPTLLEIAVPVVGNEADLKQAIEERRFKDKIVGFDDDAYAAGVYNVPTYYIGGKPYAEQPYANLRKAILEVQTGGA